MTIELDLLGSRVYLAVPGRLTPASAWHEHIPFAMFSVGALRPRVIVELGVQHGDSYCALCQAVQGLSLDSRCYGIDHWKGDPQTGFYGPEVLADLRAYHDPLYGSFSRLVQSSFDEALAHFGDGTIDLLHIDGYHDYEAVRHDYEAWRPKMSQRGVILLHDTNVREREFGVWRLWSELQAQYRHFEFFHGHGLGVVAVGAERLGAFEELFAASADDATGVRAFFFELGHRLTVMMGQRSLQDEVARARGEGDSLARKELAGEVEALRGAVQALEHALGAQQDRVAKLARERDELAREREELTWEREALGRETAALRETLARIEASLGWGLLSRFRGARNRLLGGGTRRRRLFDSVIVRLNDARKRARARRES